MANPAYLNHLFEEVEGLPTTSAPSNFHQVTNPLHPFELSSNVPDTVPSIQNPLTSLDSTNPSPWQSAMLPDHKDDDEENDDDEDDDDVDVQSPQTLTPEAGRKRKQELHRRHSKRYRDNLCDLFQSLEQLLPKVVPGCKLKTKNQIIANSVQAVKRLRAEVSSLEMQYVLSSPANRTKWVEDTVRKATCFQEVAEAFMKLLVGIQRWKHSELWSRYEAALTPDGRETGQPVDMPTNTVGDLLPSATRFYLKLERVANAHDITATKVPEEYLAFSKLSEAVTFSSGDDSLVGRIASRLSPEWIDLTDPDNSRGFKRSESAKKCGFSVCFAVPFLVRGRVFATILFYDDMHRTDIGPDINIAQTLSSCLGNCYGASVAQNSVGNEGIDG